MQTCVCVREGSPARQQPPKSHLEAGIGKPFLYYCCMAVAAKPTMKCCCDFKQTCLLISLEKFFFEITNWASESG